MTQPSSPRQTLSEPRLLHDLAPHEFSSLTEPYRRELQAHCYRMLGALQDAEDLVQETLLRAWQRRETYAGRASLRIWLYKIATNLCLDTLERRKRRTLPIVRQKAATLDEPIPPDVDEPIWLEPFPDALLPTAEMTPEARFSMRENISLAFLVLLQQLPPRQRAVLTLRDVLDWQASEVAELLELTVPAVKSLLFRARRTLAAQPHGVALDDTRPVYPDSAMRALLERYTTAWEMADIDELVTLLKEDATFSMPPIPTWYQGRKTIGNLVAKTIFRGNAQGRWRLQPTWANGQVAFGLYRVGETAGVYHPYGIQVVKFEYMMIADITTFRVPALFPKFELSTILSSN
ncbi:sigma-70 family RNA polymerase sigma factor [soil metagenome]